MGVAMSSIAGLSAKSFSGKKDAASIPNAKIGIRIKTNYKAKQGI